MRLSCLPVSLYPDLLSGRLTPGGWFRLAAALGLDGADLSVAHVRSRSPAYLDDLKAESVDAGVSIAMLVTYTDFTQPNASRRAQETDELRRWIDAAARLGASYLRVTAGQAHPDVSESDGLDWAVAGLVACLDPAEAAGVRLLYENHVRGAAWTRNDFTQPAARFLQVVHRTAESSLGVLFDTANNLALDEDDGNPLALFEQVKDRVGAVHLSDLRRRGAFEPVLVGRGVAPIPALLAALVGAGFDGWISVEEASHSGPDAFPAAVAFADAAWIEAGGRPRTLAQPAAASSPPPSGLPRLP